MKKILITGLRSLHDTGVVDIKPINVLVGTNSSGKSTFLRTFPLLRQSVEKRTRGPILWNGTYVDFGSYSNAIHQNDEVNGEGKSIALHFSFDYRSRVNWKDFKSESLAISINILPTKDKLSCYTNIFMVGFDDHTFTFTLDKDGNLLKVDSPRVNWELNKDDIRMTLSDPNIIFPVILNRDFSYNFNADRKKSNPGNNQNSFTLTTLRRTIFDLIKEHTGSRSDNKTNRMTRQFIGILRTNKEKLTLFSEISSTLKWSKLTSSWNEESSDFLYLSALIDLHYFLNNSYEINSQLTQSMRNVRYIAPLRASTERYYRYQDLSIDELDHRGDNIAMFLTNIPKGWKNKLDEWTDTHYGFTILDKRSTGHVNIQIKYDDDNISDNVTDMGFGFSQVLPIIIQLWSVASGYEKTLKNNHELQLNNSAPYIFAIEQPELHLHPRMQANLAPIFNNAIDLGKKNNINIKLIIETHSEALISKFGDLVALEELDEDEIQVMLFEQDRKKKLTQIKYSSFDSDGALKYWPTGFFAY